MSTSNLIKTSFINAILSALYISVISLIMSNGQRLFGNANGIFGGIAILLLFVISAAIMGYLILGKPILMYLDGAKKEAVKLFYLTITWLILIAVIIFICLAIFK